MRTTDMNISMKLDPVLFKRYKNRLQILQSMIWLQFTLKKAANWMVKSVNTNFKQQGRPQKWADWSARYKEWRTRIGARGWILRLSGKYTPSNATRGKRKKTRVYNMDVWGSLMDTSRSLKFTKRGFTLGTNLKYAAAQHFGYPPKNLPARPYLFFQTIDEIAIVEIFVKDIEKLMYSGFVGGSVGAR